MIVRALCGLIERVILSHYVNENSATQSKAEMIGKL